MIRIDAIANARNHVPNAGAELVTAGRMHREIAADSEREHEEVVHGGEPKE